MFRAPLARSLRFTPARCSTRAAAVKPDEDRKRALSESQKVLRRLGPAEEVRTIVHDQTFGTLCLLSSDKSGMPTGALCAYAVDSQGCIICSFSDLSQHKRDLRAEPKASIVIAETGFRSMADKRCSLSGLFTEVPQGEDGECREVYKAAHPDAFWVDFKDFSFFRMDSFLSVSYNGGFGRAAKVTPEQYLGASPDPVLKFSAPVCGHMNDDHMDAICAIIGAECGVQASEARMTQVDQYGFDAQCVVDGEPIQLRVAFDSPALERKAVKDQLVLLTKRAKK